MPSIPSQPQKGLQPLVHSHKKQYRHELCVGNVVVLLKTFHDERSNFLVSELLGCSTGDEQYG
jgi:hypothetical protein